MTVSTGTINFYDAWNAVSHNAANCDTDSFEVLLCTSSYTPNAAHATISDITSEVSGNGYARQSVNVSFTQTGGVGKFDFSDPSFTASGGSIVARYWVLRDSTVDALVAWGLIDSTNVDVTTTDGNSLTMNLDADGLYNT